MKVVILAGGYGTRLTEETTSRPKPMVEIGDYPILWHIMNIYSNYGINDFIIACGYKASVIKNYFYNFNMHNSDVYVDLRAGEPQMLNNATPDWRIHAIDTGLDTNTGGRLKALKSLIGNETFMCTYGDGLSDVPLDQLLAFHKAQGRLATVSAVHPPARFGLLEIENDRVARFSEKPQTENDWINGGFFVFEPGVLDYVEGPDSSLERDVLERIAADGQLAAFCHRDFFQPMDTLRDKHRLEELWQSGKAPWTRKP